MAKATRKIHRLELSEEEKRKLELENIETLLLDNKEAVEKVFKILHYMKERGALDFAGSLLGQGDKVLDILVKTADTPETANTLKNMLLMLGALGTLNVQQLEPLILKVNTGIARMAELDKAGEDAKTGYFSLLRSLRDPNIKTAMSLMVAFLKGLGEDQSELERTTQMPEEQEVHYNDDAQAHNKSTGERVYTSSIPSHRNNQKKRGGNWIWAAASLSLLAVPLALSRKGK